MNRLVGDAGAETWVRAGGHLGGVGTGRDSLGDKGLVGVDRFCAGRSCTGEKRDSPPRGERVWCVRRGHSAGGDGARLGEQELGATGCSRGEVSGWVARPWRAAWDGSWCVSALA